MARLLEQAAQLRAHNKLREAEILLTRAQQAEGENLAVWQAMLALQLQITEEALAGLPHQPQARGSALVEAAKELERARATLNAIRGVSIQPLSKVDPKAVVESEAAFAKSATWFHDMARTFCDSRIAEARSWRAEAKHWYWKNDRTRIVNGLRELRWVETLAPWTDDETRGAIATVMAELKGLVGDDEWAGLRARAGFDPNTPSGSK